MLARASGADGIAFFPGLSIDTAGNFALRATSGTATVTSTGITVQPRMAP
jgi:hypothetical protein